MSHLIADFVAALRRAGIRVSPAEGIEAGKAALAVGIESRSALRAALRATLAKSLEESRLFDQTFDAHFAPPRPRRDGRAGSEGGGAGGGSGGNGHGTGRKVPQPRKDDDTPRGGPRTRAVEPSRRPGERPGRGKEGERRDGLEPRTPRARAGEGRTRRILVGSEERGSRGRDEREAADAGRAAAAGGDPRRRDLNAWFSSEEEAALAREIPALIQTLRLKAGRRYRGGRRGRLWVKRTIRRSLAHGGVPFELPMKERRPRTPRVVLLVDVSHSVARAAGLFSLLCLGLSERLRKVECHFFVDRVVEATGPLRAWAAGRPLGPLDAGGALPTLPHPRSGGGRRAGRGSPGAGIAPRGGAPFHDLLRSLPGLNLAAPSDYGRVFYQARVLMERSGGRDAVLVVLGDARTNQRDPLVWAFEEIAGRCRRVLWLNPEPHRLWDTADSVMGAYVPSCDVVCEARDLAGLARGVREMLRSL